MKLKWIPWVLSIGFMVFVLSRITEYEHIAEAFQKGNLLWILVALLLQVCFFMLLGRIYHLGFRAAGMKRSYFSMLPVVMASVFANTLTPSAGIAGTAVFVKEGRRGNHTSVRSTTGFIIETVFQQLGFVMVIAGAVLYLFLAENKVLILEASVAGLVFLIILTQVIFLAIAYIKPSLFEKILHFLSSLGNWLVKRFRKKPLVPRTWSDERSAEMVEIVAGAMSDKKLWVLGLMSAVLMQICMLLTYFAIFLAFGQEISVSAAVSSFIASSIAGSILLGPQGIGLVEAGLALILTHYGIPSGSAALMAITFRVFNFWLPLLVGFISFRRLKLFEEK
jgi:uncharacterized protein (TIRG00374 family)